MAVNIAVEGDLDEVMLRRVLDFAGVAVMNVYGKRGKDHIRGNIVRYNQAARYSPWVVLVDLNNDAQCAPLLLDAWLPQRHPHLQLRIAVRGAEAWLLADRFAVADFLRVRQQSIPAQPEDELDPKACLINIARRSRAKTIRQDIIPSQLSSARQGPDYTGQLIQFTTSRWDPARAAEHAPSLRRTLRSLSRWKLHEPA